MMKNSFFSIVCILTVLVCKGQNLQDAVRNAEKFYSGTAKFNAMGGAIGAIGADPSTVSINPAGIGLYRKNEFSITPSVNWRIANTSYNGSDERDINSRIELNNLAFVFHNKTGNKTGLTEFAWSFSFNRTATFFQDYKIEGNNPGTSLLDEHVFDLMNPSVISPGDINLEPSLAYGAALSYNTFLTDYDSDFNEYFHANSFYEGSQRQRVVEEGSSTNYQASVGGNFNDIFYLGGSLDLRVYSFTRSSVYSEHINNGEFTSLENFYFQENLNIRGFSTRIRLGGILQATPFLRVGLAYHFGHTTNMGDDFDTQIESDFGNGQLYRSNSPESSFSYSVRAPGRVVISSAWQIKKRAMIGIEYEVADFSKSEFSEAENGYDYSLENNFISNELTMQHALRIGGEYRRGSLAIRGGYRFTSSPYKDTDIQGNRSTYSVGIGLRNSKAFADFTYLFDMQSDQVFMYDPAFANTVNRDLSWHSVMLTLGLRWK